MIEKKCPICKDRFSVYPSQATRKTHRKKFEELGYWVPLEDKTDYEIYFNEANWKERLYDMVEGDEKILLETLGVFHAKTNSKGVVRDHMLSRRTGFEEGIFPEIMRHPANCQIITHSDNVKKKKTRYVDKDVLTIVELFDRIKAYELEYNEQETCLQKILDYENGKRWERSIKK